MLKIIMSTLMLLAFQSSLQAGTTPTLENTTKLYVATFNRAPDAAGLNYWAHKAGLDLEGIAKSFFDQEETKTAYPADSNNVDFVEAVYLNLFNRAAEVDGLVYWVGELDSGNIAKSTFILAVINGAQDTQEFGNDATILTNKTIIGLAFANAGLNDTLDAKKIMLTITDEYSSVVAAVESYGLEVPVQDKLIIKNNNDPARYGYDVFFSVFHGERSDLEYKRDSQIIMTDGNTEKYVGSHLNGLTCNRIGGYGDYREWLTDDRVSYGCKIGIKDINIILEKGKRYSFFVRYFKDGQVTGQSEIQAFVEYGDKFINTDNMNGSLPIDSLNGKILREDDNWLTEIKIDTLIVNQKSASIDYAEYNCGGYLSYAYQENEGYFFYETITYGNCTQGCNVWINADGSKFKEFCDGKLTGSGDLSEN